MKKLILLFVFTFAAITGYSQIMLIKQTEMKELEKFYFVKNNAESKVVIYQFDKDETEWQTDSSMYSEMSLDKANMTFTDIEYFPMYSKTVLKLTEDGKILSRENYNEKNELTGKNVYTYENELLKKREMYFGAMKSFDEVYEYDNGKLVNMKYLLPDGTIMNYSIFGYDKSGNIESETKYTAKGDIESTYEYKYDANGKPLEEKIIMNNNTVTKISYKYNNDLLTDMTIKDDKGNILTNSTYEYDGRGKLLIEKSESPALKKEIKSIYENGILVGQYFFNHTEGDSYMLKYIYY